MPDEKFKLPQSSYEELTKIIKAYAHFSEAVGLNEVSKFVGLNTTIISGNAGFLVGIGVLDPGARKVPTPNGRKLGHALEHNMPDEIRNWWRQIVSGNDFLTRLLSAIRIRNGMDQQTLEAHIAYSAGQPKKARFMTGARTVIDILRAAELVVEVDGKYVSEQASISSHELVGVTDAVSVSVTDKPSQRPELVIVPRPQPTSLPAPVVSIQINVNCSASEVSSLGDHIKKLMQQLSSLNADAQEEEQQGE